MLEKLAKKVAIPIIIFGALMIDSCNGSSGPEKREYSGNKSVETTIYAPQDGDIIRRNRITFSYQAFSSHKIMGYRYSIDGNYTEVGPKITRITLNNLEIGYHFLTVAGQINAYINGLTDSLGFDATPDSVAFSVEAGRR